MQQPRINATTPIIRADGTMDDQFRDLFTQLTDNLPLTGVGTPETFVEAFQFSYYIDTAGATGNILYIKRNTDIGGDTKQGWILV